MSLTHAKNLFIYAKKFVNTRNPRNLRNNLIHTTFVPTQPTWIANPRNTRKLTDSYHKQSFVDVLQNKVFWKTSKNSYENTCAGVSL